MDTKEIERVAREELRHERFRREVEETKDRLQQVRPLWHRVFPWRIKIERR